MINRESEISNPAAFRAECGLQSSSARTTIWGEKPAAGGYNRLL
jgi:hypothetical protein